MDEIKDSDSAIAVGGTTAGEFGNSLLVCASHINELLPNLRRRYDTIVILSALAVHMGCALRRLRELNTLNDQQTLLAIRHIENAAFQNATRASSRTFDSSLMKSLRGIMFAERAEHRARVRQCAAEIRAQQPALADRHTPLVVVATLTEYLGGASPLSQESRSCRPGRARTIIDQVMQIAFESEADTK